ncbi:MAG: hypothetical protein ROR55_26465 [Devosia sp.]
MNTGRFGDPKALRPARAQAHAAAQLLYRAAMSNLAPLPGDEHTNLGWDALNARFQTHSLNATGARVELSLNPLELVLGAQTLSLAGVSMADAFDWIDTVLVANGLKATRPIVATYDLPADVLGVAAFVQTDGLAPLANWFDLAAKVLQAFADDVADIEPGPSPVRCWPHHFDIATYVRLEASESEDARGVGVGMSPGDSSFDEPYFYVNPWPHLPREGLPPAVPPGHWHTNGFVGSVATGTQILTLPDIAAGTDTFLRESFQAGRMGLGT